MEKKEVRTRRVGTLTCGFSLIAAGVLYLFKQFGIMIGYLDILSFWPVILIGLGIEVLISSFKPEQVTYDKAAIFLMIVMAFFAMGMGGAEFFMTEFAEYMRLH